MNLAYARTLWEEMRLVTGITLRAIQALPDDSVDKRPIRDMRTPKELICHMAETMRHCALGATRGSIEAFEKTEPEKCAALKSREDLFNALHGAWTDADIAVRSLTDAQATGPVQTPWGFTPPGWLCVQIIFDEHLHHRGQLYAYLRALAVEPPFMWDFEKSASEFQPKQHQPA
jgi:uncharacterized damage-inducible protein DinB